MKVQVLKADSEAQPDSCLMPPAARESSHADQSEIFHLDLLAAAPL